LHFPESLVAAADVSSPEQIFDIMAAGFEHRAVGCHDVRRCIAACC